jgi:two-component sensor histidine kinase
VALLAPAIGAASILMWNAERQARRAIEQQLTETARALTLVVDRQLGQQAALLGALSTSPSLKAGDWAAFHAEAKAAVKDPNSWVVVADPGLQQVVNTRFPLGEKLPRMREGGGGFSWAGERRGEARISNMFHGPLAQRPVTVVATRARLDDGRVVDLAMTMDVHVFDRVFADQGLPKTWTGSLVDSHGRLMSRSRDGARFIGRSASPDMLKAMAAGRSGVVRTQTLDGVKTSSAFNRMPEYRWAVIVGVPREEMTGTALQALMWGSLAAVLLLTLGLVMAVAVAKSVAKPIEALAATARSTARAPGEPPPPSGIAEIDELAAAFATAVAAVDARDQHQRLLINELNHRVKNTLATVQSIAHQTLPRSAVAVEARDLLTSRLLALSAAHNVLTRENWEGADAADVVAEAIRPYDDPGDGRFEVDGPPLRLGPGAALALSMALHELATNAAKYGALSTPMGEGGRVAIHWRLDAEQGFIMEWRERGGPRVTPPARRGFGSRLLQQGLAIELGGAAELIFAPEGLVCVIRAPLALTLAAA